MSSEQRYPDGYDYLRFTNNAGYEMLEMTAILKGVDLEFVRQLVALSHWTYQVTTSVLSNCQFNCKIGINLIQNRQFLIS